MINRVCVSSTDMEESNYFIQIKKQIRNIPLLGVVMAFIWHSVSPLVRRYKKFNALHSLNALMERIEYYQPLYNFPLSIAKQPQRVCFDRAAAIYQHLNVSEKGLRILDVGCSLGYFAYYFSEQGYLVSGIDYDAKNIEVCRLLQQFNKRKANFSVAEFSDSYLNKINADQFDVGFLFSVLHHSIHAQGLSYVQKLMVELLDKIPLLFVELAVKDEQTTAAWKDSLPDDELAVFSECTGLTIERIGSFSNHLSAVKRPLYRVKKNTVRFADVEYPVLALKYTAFQGACYNGRSYYDCGDVFIKKYLLSSRKDNLIQISNEINNYSRLPPENNFFPRFLSFQQRNNVIEIMLTKLPGINLYDLLSSGQKVSAFPIFAEVVNAAAFLLEHGLYHNDLRLWNIMIDGEKVYCFDLGMADKEEKESTNLALQWMIAKLHCFDCEEMLHPLTAAPDIKSTSLPAVFANIFDALQKTRSFSRFLEWWKEKGLS